MKSFGLKLSQLLAIALIPLEQSNLWHQFQFTAIQPNQVQFAVGKLSIQVNQSSSPLLFRFDQPTMVQGFEVKATAEGNIPKFKKDQIQGQEHTDDFLLRFGLIIKGKSRLNWVQRQLAPTWLVKMEKLLPSAYGIKEVQFYTTCRQSSLLNQVRRHILDSSLIEKCITQVSQAGAFELKKSFSEPKEVVGLWVGADGDQTHSDFKVEISEIKINYK